MSKKSEFILNSLYCISLKHINFSLTRTLECTSHIFWLYINVLNLNRIQRSILDSFVEAFTIFLQILFRKWTNYIQEKNNEKHKRIQFNKIGFRYLKIISKKHETTYIWKRYNKWQLYSIYLAFHQYFLIEYYKCNIKIRFYIIIILIYGTFVTKWLSIDNNLIGVLTQVKGSHKKKLVLV